MRDFSAEKFITQSYTKKYHEKTFDSKYQLQVQEDIEGRKSWKTATVLYGLGRARVLIPFGELLDCQAISECLRNL